MTTKGYSQTTHICVNIEGLLRNYKGKSIDIFYGDDGKLIPDSKVRIEIDRLLNLGHKLIKTSGCDNFDPFKRGCLGHPLTPNKTT